jgi:hypothetical protein
MWENLNVKDDGLNSLHSKHACKVTPPTKHDNTRHFYEEYCPLNQQMDNVLTQLSVHAFSMF